METVAERFLRYTRIDTRADENSGTVPSSPGQRVLGALLVEELQTMGLADAAMDANGYVTATLPETVPGGPVVGLIAHMDTSPDFSGASVQPRVLENYDGGPVTLGPGVVMSPEVFPELADYQGQTLIVTDGATLLGADDKAGIAEIMTAAAYLLAHPEIPRCRARICFTPDEEIGQGADHFDVKAFGADFAYTVDGGQLGELEFENFNAATVTIRIQGVNIHPGAAKNKMKNAVLIGHEIVEMLPPAETPAHTTDYEGFFHVMEFNGVVEQATLRMLIRDHDLNLFELRKAAVRRIAAYLNEKHGDGTVSLTIEDSYYNMRDKILPVYHIVETARAVMESLGIRPLIRPVRGGTDGARLSYMGLPTPNLFTGGHNFHGKFEYIPVESMNKAVATITGILQAYAGKEV